jgi:FAD/FMN-containing dehydrogenase
MGVGMMGLDGEPVEVDERALDVLSAQLHGPLLRPGDAGFDGAVQIWNAMISKTPALVVQPESAEDVREVVRFARAHNLLSSVKGGGHNIAGTSLADGGLTLDMSRMRRVEVDPQGRIARVSPGCLLGDVDRATQEHGLATVLGFVSQTGVAGLTLGGGFGSLTRRFGASVHNLEEVEIVTAEGEIRRAAGDEHENLFWALRGGGGNFGVVTRFTFSLHEVGPEITGGLIFWDAEQADDVLALYREVTEAASRELTVAVILRVASPAPYIPQRWHGRPIVGMLVCHSGEASQAAKELAPIKNFGKPIADVITRKRYVEQQTTIDASQPKGLHNYWKSEFLPRLSTPVLDEFRLHGAGITSPMSMMMIFQLGGALADQEPDATSFSNQDAEYICFAAGAWPPYAGNAERHLAWVRSAWEAIHPHSTGGNYINTQTADEDESRLGEAYRANLDRLAKVKAIYDPDNLFRVNRNIAPAP